MEPNYLHDQITEKRTLFGSELHSMSVTTLYGPFRSVFCILQHEITMSSSIFSIRKLTEREREKERGRKQAGGGQQGSLGVHHG